MSVTSIDKDLDGLTMTLVADFEAPAERVWELFAEHDDENGAHLWRVRHADGAALDIQLARADGGDGGDGDGRGHPGGAGQMDAILAE